MQSGYPARLARVVAAAEETSDSRDKAARWLRRETSALDGKAPFSLLDTCGGSRQVEDLLAMIDHGLAV